MQAEISLCSVFSHNISEHELKQSLAKITKLLHLILTIPATSASGEKSSSRLKRVNNYMMFSQSEELLSNLILICMNKDILMKWKLERGADSFYNKVFDEFYKHGIYKLGEKCYEILGSNRGYANYLIFL